MNNFIKIEKYKGIDLKYCKGDGCIYFSFEDRERKVKYAFEAKAIIDEPVWESCDLKGYFIDGVFKDYIGKAIATKKDIKSGEPYWLLRGEYDIEYKRDRIGGNNEIVFLKSQENDKIYEQFKKQKLIVALEERKLRNIISELK